MATQLALFPVPPANPFPPALPSLWRYPGLTAMECAFFSALVISGHITPNSVLAGPPAGVIAVGLPMDKLKMACFEVICVCRTKKLSARIKYAPFRALYGSAGNNAANAFRAWDSCLYWYNVHYPV